MGFISSTISYGPPDVKPSLALFHPVHEKLYNRGEFLSSSLRFLDPINPINLFVNIEFILSGTTTGSTLTWNVSLNGRRGMGAEKSYACWGTVNGFKLPYMKSDHITEFYSIITVRSDGEWFVTACLANNIEFEYAVAWRSVIIREMGLEFLDGTKKFDGTLNENFKGCWNWSTIRQRTIDIVENNLPIGAIRLRGEKEWNPTVKEYCDHFQSHRDEVVPIGFRCSYVDLVETNRSSFKYQGIDKLVRYFCDFVEKSQTTNPVNSVTHLTITSELETATWTKLSRMLQYNTSIFILDFKTATGTVSTSLSLIPSQFSEAIASYLFRNRALVAESSVSDALQNTAAAVAKETKQETLDLHNRYLGYSELAMKTLFDGLNIDKLLTLDLSHNFDRDSFEIQTPNSALCKVLASYLKKNSSLTALNIAYNMFDSIGFGYLAETMSENRRLKKIDVTGNYILIGRSQLSEMRENFSQNATLQTVTLSHNFLKPECDELISSATESSRTAASPHRLFFSRPEEGGAPSLMHPYKTITTRGQGWLVALACKRGSIFDEHAMIYLEGMRPSGQRFLERYHISAEGLVGTAMLNHDAQVPKLFKPELYYFNPHSITSVQGRDMQNRVNEEKNNPPGFSLLYGSKSGRVNCLDWCLKHLRLIDVKIDNKTLPSRTVQKAEEQPRTCLVM